MFYIHVPFPRLWQKKSGVNTLIKYTIRCGRICTGKSLNSTWRVRFLKIRFQMFILCPKELFGFADYGKVWRLLKKLFYLELLDKNCFLKELAESKEHVKVDMLKTLPMKYMSSVRELCSCYWPRLPRRLLLILHSRTSHLTLSELQLRFMQSVLNTFELCCMTWWRLVIRLTWQLLRWFFSEPLPHWFVSIQVVYSSGL